MVRQQEGGRGEAMMEAPIVPTLGSEVRTTGMGARLTAAAIVHPKGMGWADTIGHPKNMG